MAEDNPPPMLGSDTLRSRAANSGAIFEARQRARERTTEQFETVDDPSEVPIRRQEGGFGPSDRFLEQQRPREAAARLDPQFGRQDLGPSDVRATDEGFVPREPVQRRAAAFEFEAETPLGDVDPQADVQRQPGGGFGLAPQAEREAAAAEIDPQFPGVDLGASDIERQDGGGFGLAPSGERAIAAERFEDDTRLQDVGPGDVQRQGDAFELADDALQRLRERF